MAVTNTYNEFLKAELESEKTQSQIKKLQDWLTGQTQLQQQQYQQTAQTAATQASYDISGAYANYLKQQRSIASQGQLETGYKEELGDVLESQYSSAYQQAKATQAENVASAAETYAKNVYQYSKEASEAVQSYYKSPNEDFILANGDSIDLLKEFDFKFDMIFADPPYFLSNGGISLQSGKVVCVDKGDWDKCKSKEDVMSFNLEWLRLCRDKLKDNGTIWISGTYHNIFSVLSLPTSACFLLHFVQSAVPPQFPAP